MLKAINLMINCKKYKIKTSKLYQNIKLHALSIGVYKTTVGRVWVTNGKQDIFLKNNQKIPNGFWQGRTINFTKEQKQSYSQKISKTTIGRKSWNNGKNNVYSQQYRQKISQNHADFSGQKNGRFGSRAMIKIQTQQKLIVAKENIQQFLNKGYFFTKDLKKFNNGKIEILAKECPTGFKLGKLKNKNLNKELKEKVWVSNLVTNQVCLIKKQEVELFLNNGFILGNKRYQILKNKN